MSDQVETAGTQAEGVLHLMLTLGKIEFDEFNSRMRQIARIDGMAISDDAKKSLCEVWVGPTWHDPNLFRNAA